MGKGKKKKGNTFQDSQKTSIERASDLIANKKAEEEAKLLKEEKVQAKIEEYNALIAEAKKKYEISDKELKDSYQLKQKELEEERISLEILKEQLEEEKESIKNEKEKARREAIEEIRNDEKYIRDKERANLFEEWNHKIETEKENLNKYINEKRIEIDKELSETHKTRIEAEETKMKASIELNEKLENRLHLLNTEYNKKYDELSVNKIEYMKLKAELDADKEDLEEEKAYVRQQREKYSKYSAEQVLRLEGQIQDMEEMIKVAQEHIKELSEKNAAYEKHANTSDGRSLIVKISELEEKLRGAEKYKDELANMPSAEEIAELRARKTELEELRILFNDEQLKRIDAESKINNYAMSTRELENARISAAALESLNNQLQMKLKYISEQYESTQESKFKSLLEIDEKVDAISNIAMTTIDSSFSGELKDLVTYIRSYGANRHEPLFYSEETIRCFISSLATSRLLILQGLSGTGKSSLPRLFSEALNVENSFVAVQPSWRDNRELLGYDNDFTNRFKETEFTKYLYEASAIPNQNKIWLIVLDEMNLARIEYYFADFLSALEKEKDEWLIPLVSGYTELDEAQKPKYLNYDNVAANILVTDNIWFVGTANNDDSTSLITDKVYDRAQILNMDRREEPFSVDKKLKPISMTLNDLDSLFRNARKKKTNLMTKDDWDKIESLDLYLMDMNITFGNRIKKQIENFVPVYIECGGTKEGAIDYLLSHKILRKLDERYEPYLVNSLKELKEEVNNLYGEHTFKRSITKITKLIDKINPVGGYGN